MSENTEKWFAVVSIENGDDIFAIWPVRELADDWCDSLNPASTRKPQFEVREMSELTYKWKETGR